MVAIPSCSSRARAPLAALVLSAAAACTGGGGGGGGPAPDPRPSAPVLARVTLLQRAPGTEDGVAGAAAAVEAGATVIARDASTGAEIGRALAAADGSFPELPLGDNAHGAIALVASRGSVESAALVLVNDIVPPDTSFTEAPGTSGGLFRFAFSAGEPATFTCALDGEEEWPCAPGVRIGPLPPGSHTFTVSAVDLAGNAEVSPASHAWTAVNGWWQVAVGPAGVACALDTERRLFCWGTSSFGALGRGAETSSGVPGPVQSDGEWLQVSVGSTHACGVKTDRSLWCWGGNFHGQLGWPGDAVNVPTRVGTEASWAAIATGDVHTCALDAAGALRCWGDNQRGQLGTGDTAPVAGSVPIHVPAGTRWTAVAAGLNHTCGLRDDTSLWCWGLECGLRDDGSLWCWGVDEGGHVDPAAKPPAAPFSLGTGWDRVFASHDTACGRTLAGEIRCWGRISGGGSGWTEVPTRVGDFAGATAGDGQLCVWADDRAVYCRGWNDRGQLGDGTGSNREWLAAVAGVGADTMSANGGTTCAIAGGRLACWGANDGGQLGRGHDVIGTKRSPVRVAEPLLFSELAAGPVHTCAVSVGDRWCFGFNFAGPFGNGSAESTAAPVLASTDGQWTAVAAGRNHGCGLGAGGALHCWGYNREGQVGVGAATTSSLVPLPVSAGTAWSGVAAGENHACAIRASDDALLCWGDNASGGAVGNGGASPAFLPTPVAEGQAWTAVEAGARTTCAVRSDHRLFCWGANGSGQLGVAGTGDRSTPAEVAGGHADWTAASTGTAHTCGIRDAGLFCWGANASGELGTGGPAAAEPQLVGTGYAAVAAGREHTCGIRAGAIECWGSNEHGQVGAGEAIGSAVPLAIGAATDWTHVAAGEHHTCALRNGGELWCWGSNVQGQLGDGEGWYASPSLVALPP